MIRLVTARRLRQLLADVEDLRRSRWNLTRQVLVEQAKLRLVEQAKDAAESREIYWRQRAERFIDQIGARDGIISGPTMTEPAAPPEDRMLSVFGALGKSEINQDKAPAARAASSAAPLVTGVDATFARQLVDETLAAVRS